MISEAPTKKPGLKGLKNIKRKAIGGVQEELVKTRFFQPDQPLPLVVEPAVAGVDLTTWATNNRTWLERNLAQYGCLLFRGFTIAGANEFEHFIAAVSGEPLEYRERSSPRSQVSGNIYTSTDYPADQPIFLHNENSYSHTWPLKIFFFCATEPETGGETPLADVRKVLEHLSPATRARFAEKGVMYVRNLSDELGLSWPTVFQTHDRAAVEAYCTKAGYDFTWRGENGLQTRRTARAIINHVKSGEPLWFNHATFFHVTTLEPATRDALLALYAEEDLPNNTYYGDGSSLEPATLDELRRAYQQETVAFPWQKGDLLMLDNMLVAHARRPFTGPRKILTGMAEPFRYQDLREVAQ
ncbi:MAG: TauD/TfdA family dioxygenase [Caldilineaceae bacterium]